MSERVKKEDGEIEVEIEKEKEKEIEEEFESSPYKMLLTHIASISGQSIRELLPQHPSIMPTEWFKELFRRRLDDTVTGPEWKIARTYAQLPFPPVSYGIYTDRPIHPQLGQLIPEINVHDKNWIMSHVRDPSSICQHALDDHTISYSLLKANAVVYAYYHDDERDKDIVIGMIYLFYPAEKHHIDLPVVCADGSFDHIGSTLLSLVKTILLIHVRPYASLTLHPLEQAVRFYRTRGFIWKRQNIEMIWHPSYRDIFTLLEQYPAFQSIIRVKFKKYYAAYQRDKKRQYLMQLMEESEYEDSFGGRSQRKSKQRKSKQRKNKQSLRKKSY